MALRERPVAVKQLPEVINGKQARTFLRELKISTNVEHPFIVLDCSQLRQMDLSGLRLVLCCLEEAMKRNGDVRIDAMTRGARAALESTGVDGLFEIFDTTTEAVDCFLRLPGERGSHAFLSSRSDQVSENAA